MGKVFAIIGDIHSNIDALNVVLEDCRAQGVTDFLCTGDIVGYGACPKECLAAVRDLNCPVVMGNHDYYVAKMLDLRAFNPAAAAVVEWTRETLGAADVEWLGKVPFTAAKMGIGLVHSTNDNPAGFGYVFDNLQAEANFVFQKTSVCFHGHTHCPMIYERSSDGVYRIDPQDITLPMGRKYFINVGSVGQPRDGDPRASYVIYDAAAKTVRFRRLAYDVFAAQQRIRQAGLPDRLADRLAEGH